MAPSPSHRLRFAVGVALAGLLGGWLCARFVGQAVRHETGDVERRQAVVTLQGLSELVRRVATDGDAARRSVADWQAKTPEVAQVRVLFLSGIRLEASTAPADTGDKAAPRRLAREEKPFFDRGQRIAAAVRANRDEDANRKPEIEIAPAPTGRRLSLAGPVESEGNVVGLVEIETADLPAQHGEPPWLYLLAAAGALVVFLVGSLFIGPRRYSLGALAVLATAGALLGLTLTASHRVAAARHGAARAVGDTVIKQAALVQALSGGAPVESPARWDVDAYRRPLGFLTDSGAVDAGKLAEAGRASDDRLWRSVLAADALALLVMLAVGFGAVNRFGTAFWKNRRAYAYVAPAMVGVLILVFFPFIYGITLSFTDSNIYNTSSPLSELWVGLDNYAAILGDFSIVKHGEGGSAVNYLNFYWTLGFTIFWTATNVAIGVSSGLVLALILNTKNLAARPLYRVLLILPWAMPNYITALIWKGMFHRQFGVINQVLQMFGIAPLSWFDHPFTSYLTALATNGWLSFPFMMVVSLGALQSIPGDIYEAARVDGANRWQAFKAITLPSLRPALVPAVIISVVWTFNMFNIIYLVTAGEPGGATEILVTQSYKFAFERYRYGYAAAYSTVIFAILLIYGVIQNRVSKATEA